MSRPAKNVGRIFRKFRIFRRNNLKTRTFPGAKKWRAVCLNKRRQKLALEKMTTETLLQLNPASLSPPRANALERSSDGEEFSFNAAVISLEARAAQSLETHGARPAENAVNDSANTSEQDDLSPARQEQRANPSAQNTDQRAQNAPTQANERNPLSTQPQFQAVQAQQPLPPQLIGAQAIQQTANAAVNSVSSSAPRIEATLPRQSDAQLATKTKQRPQTQATARTADPAPNDFAKILAKRLTGGASQFEVRLDPPELGRVEAQLRVSDKGDAVVSLAFESADTLDLFARDEAALRNQLEFAGFDLDGKNFVFSLIEAGGESDPELKAPLTQTLSEAQFTAINTNSSGLVDIQA